MRRRVGCFNMVCVSETELEKLFGLCLSVRSDTTFNRYPRERRVVSGMLRATRRAVPVEAKINMVALEDDGGRDLCVYLRHSLGRGMYARNNLQKHPVSKSMRL